MQLQHRAFPQNELAFQVADVVASARAEPAERLIGDYARPPGHQPRIAAKVGQVSIGAV
jgi:hypothetical protein